MGFARSVRTCLAKYFTFSGRASRPEYWWFVLFLLLGNAVTAAIDLALFGGTRNVTASGISVQSNGPLAAAFALGTLIPGLSAGWRRMHDTGRSGLFMIYPLIVMVGMGSFAGLVDGLDVSAGNEAAQTLAGFVGIVLIVAALVLLISPLLVIWWLSRPSDPGPNKYGPNPQEVLQ
ncbi:DUF805 domain-containing protein [Rhodovulum adriaticum]|uniref:Uncharacterized membrane protein YhaH (DUF805 family) n=1 Tax=Rhodovulum adriaticum TaxID=35804 RepID=A0A4R2NNB5_RHOAD|nr:DUF805 domain-containing protein [Rhodovulum adriaticum]MBK1636739.1 DUF805 domain-containing protein [Rhodovulum adriaticum]TCP22785.1 uncharacterized membrane protein YhaH (DUF805 family) [Rhodovulum adriaticum]